MKSVKGISLKYFAAVIAVIAIVFGIWQVFFHSKGFEKTEAVIVAVEEVPDEGTDDSAYIATVRYTVNGETYTQTLDTQSASYKEGKTITVLYDPNDPSVIHSGRSMGIYFLVIGVVILAVIAVSEFNSRSALKELEKMKAEQPEAPYAPSVKGEERQLYFMTDLGTPKYGHRIEDRERRVLYEAKMTKYTLTTPFGFDFIDHEHGTTTPHLIGHEESSEWDSFILDNHYTFSFDGEPIWEHLKKNGIHVESDISAGESGRLVGTNYRIFRDGEEIAYAESSSQYAHEEDAEKKGKRGNLVPVAGFFRVRTTEEDLALLFVTLLAFARTSASDDKGGNYGALKGTFQRIKRKD